MGGIVGPDRTSGAAHSRKGVVVVVDYVRNRVSVVVSANVSMVWRKSSIRSATLSRTAVSLAFVRVIFRHFSFGFVLFSYCLFLSLAKNFCQEITKNIMINFQRVCPRVFLSHSRNATCWNTFIGHANPRNAFSVFSPTPTHSNASSAFSVFSPTPT